MIYLKHPASLKIYEDMVIKRQHVFFEMIIQRVLTVEV